MYSHLKISDFLLNQFLLLKDYIFILKGRYVNKTAKYYISHLTQTVQDKENGYMMYMNMSACKVNV